jgi:hypothetical protein
LGDVKAAFNGRVLEIDHSVADQWGRMNASDPFRPSMACLRRRP